MESDGTQMNVTIPGGPVHGTTMDHQQRNIWDSSWSLAAKLFLALIRESTSLKYVFIVTKGKFQCGPRVKVTVHPRLTRTLAYSSFQRQETNCQLEVEICQVVSKCFMVSIISPPMNSEGKGKGEESVL